MSLQPVTGEAISVQVETAAQPIPESLNVLNNYIRFHALDLLYFRPSVSPTHIDLQLGMLIHFTGLDNVAASDAHEVLLDMDYTNGQNNVDPPFIRADNAHLYKIQNGQYIPTDSNAAEWSNIRLEDAFVAKLPTPSPGLMTDWGFMRRDYHLGNNSYTPYEGTYLTNLMISLAVDVYLSYFSQAQVRTGVMFPASVQASTSVIYGGDTFLSEYTFITYGLVTRKDIVNNTGITDWKNA